MVFIVMDEPILEEEEKYIILQAIKALHQLKYIADIAILMQENKDLMVDLIEEIVAIRQMINKGILEDE